MISRVFLLLLASLLPVAVVARAEGLRILQADDLSRPGVSPGSGVNKKMRYKVLLEAVIDEQALEQMVDRALADIRRQDPEVDEVILWIYSDPNGLGDAYDVASAIWAPEGELGRVTPEIAAGNDRAGYEVTIQPTAWSKDGLKAFLSKRAEPQSVGGLSEAKRRAIHRRIVAAEDRAKCDTDRLFGVTEATFFKTREEAIRHDQKLSQLEKQYREEVLKSEGLSKAQSDAISVEAFEENWPLPDPASCP